MKSTTDYTLKVTTYRGHRVLTFESMIAALTKMADDYDEDGEPSIAVAFRLFAESLVPEAVSSSRSGT